MRVSSEGVRKRQRIWDGWTFARPRIDEVLPSGRRFNMSGPRPQRQPPTGVYAIHQGATAIVSDAFT